MATDTETPVAPEPDPSQADTPEPDTDDTVPATPASPKVDWEQRYRAQQSELTRVQQALAQKRSEPSPSGEPQGEDWKQKWEQSEWARVQAVHGPEVVGAYDSFYRVYSTDATPMGTISALESYHQARMAGQTPAQAAPGQAPSPAVAAPRVDSNRSDASPDTDLDQSIEGAKAKGDLMGFIRASIRPRP